jgi:hypothetical protein
MQYRDPSFTPAPRKSRPFFEEKSRKEDVRMAAMGEVGLQKPAVTVEGREVADEAGAERRVRGLWRTGDVLG